MIDDKEIILKKFGICDTKEIKPFGTGLINNSFKVLTKNGQVYLLQRLNSIALPKIDIVLKNIEVIGDFLTNLGENCLKLCKTTDGDNHITDADGFIWRVYPFIENSNSYDFTTNEKVISQVAYGFGRFDKLVKGIRDGAVKYSDDNFHNTREKYEGLIKATNENLANRLKEVENEVAIVQSLIELANTEGLNLFEICDKRNCGELKTQVVHNDTKLNNCLLDKDDNYLCVVDLDTAMPGLVINDYADGVRYIANTTTEDEEDLEKVDINFNSLKAYTFGFFSGLDFAITKEELELLPLSLCSIAFELGCRFLADYLNGDVFFKIEDTKPNLNLIRARVQFKLCSKFIENYAKIEGIINDIFMQRVNLI